VKSFCLILVLALSLPACSRFSETARRQRAYEKYVHKSMGNRARQQAKFTQSRAPQMPLSDAGPVTETTTEEGPQAVPREQAEQTEQ
jgi:hypothetical protein